jgi:hypothetical protein
MGGVFAKPLTIHDIVQLYLNIVDPQFARAAPLLEKAGDAECAALCWLALHDTASAQKVLDRSRMAREIKDPLVTIIRAVGNGKQEEIINAVSDYRVERQSQQSPQWLTKLLYKIVSVPATFYRG